MKIWILKAIVQKLISFLPGKHKINFLFQKYITKGVRLSDAYFEDKFSHAENHFKSFQKYSKKELPKTILELGSGWYPVVPLYFFLMGVDSIYTADISALMKKSSILETIDRYLDYAEQNDNQFQPKRIKSLQDIVQNRDMLSFENLLSELHFTYILGDIAKQEIESKTFDLICSNNTLEHVYAEDMKEIILTLDNYRNTQTGLHSHAIDLSDHFAHLDKSITVYNFLQFSEGQWRLINNSIQPMNRWRVDDFRNLFQDLNFDILEEGTTLGKEEELESLALDSEFASKDKKDLLVTHCHFILG